jgi:ribosome maturation factor RimP
VADLIPQAYDLEVSSPGVERPLRNERDFLRFTGEKAKLKVRDPVNGQRVVVGILDGVQSGQVRVKEGSRVHEVPVSSIDTARLVFEFGASGGREHKKKH